MINKPGITEEEIKKLPNSGNIMLKEFAHSLYDEYQKILTESNPSPLSALADKTKEESSETGSVPF